MARQYLLHNRSLSGSMQTAHLTPNGDRLPSDEGGAGSGVTEEKDPEKNPVVCNVFPCLQTVRQQILPLTSMMRDNWKSPCVGAVRSRISFCM